jgi:hypothetical protein
MFSQFGAHSLWLVDLDTCCGESDSQGITTRSYKGDLSISCGIFVHFKASATSSLFDLRVLPSFGARFFFWIGMSYNGPSSAGLGTPNFG